MRKHRAVRTNANLKRVETVVFASLVIVEDEKQRECVRIDVMICMCEYIKQYIHNNQRREMRREKPLKKSVRMMKNELRTINDKSTKTAKLLEYSIVGGKSSKGLIFEEKHAKTNRLYALMMNAK